jgi:hypothetical protein
MENLTSITTNIHHQSGGHSKDPKSMNCLPTSVEDLHAGSRRQLHRALEAGKGLMMERHFHQGFVSTMTLPPRLPRILQFHASLFTVTYM